MFIAVDGIDGAGKTTLVAKLAELLKPLNPQITKEPTGNSRWGQQLRLAAAEGRLSRKEELEYFHKDRLQHIKEIIQPVIDEGRPVITDRYVDSSLAFQADTPEEADQLYKKSLPDILVPDLTIILRCPVKVGLDRIRNRADRPVTHFETVETLQKARAIYETRRGNNYVHVDATGTAEQTFLESVEILGRRFAEIRVLLRDRQVNYSPQDNESFDNDSIGSEVPTPLK